MKKLISIFAALSFLISTFSGCSQQSFYSDSEKLSIVTTIFPEYDWVNQIVGDSQNFDVSLLIKNGVDLHSYQPSVDDIAKISTCDIFIYVGGESDSWVDDVLKEAVNKNIVAINLIDELGESAKEEEMVEGMQDEKSDDDEEAEAEYDEHVWLSLRNARLFTTVFAEKIAELDPENGDSYKENANRYCEQLNELNERYENTVADASRNTVLFADRFPFRYLVDDYDISYYAAFNGCSAETEASFETITFLANKVNEFNLNYVLILENSDDRIAESIITASKNDKCSILTINSLQSVTSKDIDNGESYISVMKNNLNILNSALN